MKETAKSPAFQFYPNDFTGSSKVQDMTTEEVGVYIMLLCRDWKDGGFELDAKVLSRYLRMPIPKFLRAWTLVSRCFIEHDGRWWNERLERERDKQKAWSEKAKRGAATTNDKRYGAARPSEEIAIANGVANGVANASLTPRTSSSSSSSPSSSLQQRDETRKPRESSSGHVTWLTPAGTAYEAAFGVGSFDYGKAARLLAPLHKAGHDPEAIGRHLAWYIAARGDEYAHEKDDKLTIGVRGWVPNLKSFQMTYERWNPIVPDEAAA